MVGPICTLKRVFERVLYVYKVNRLWSPDLGRVCKVGTSECKISSSTNRDGLDFDRRASNIAEGFVGLGALMKDLLGP